MNWDSGAGSVNKPASGGHNEHCGVMVRKWTAPFEPSPGRGKVPLKGADEGEPDAPPVPTLIRRGFAAPPSPSKGEGWVQSFT